MSENPKFNEYKEQIIRMLATMFDCLALNGEFKVEDKGSRIGVVISSDNAGRIILCNISHCVNSFCFHM